MLLLLLKRIVVRPLARLTEHAVAIGRSNDYSRQVAMDRGDELGSLSREFDRMLEKLARSRDELARASRLIGRSEIATGIVHGVGNVLNSVNVSARLASRSAEELPADDLTRLAAVLAEEGEDLSRFVASDPRGVHLVPLLEGLAETVADQRARIQDELDALRVGVGHIADLVQAQQGLAGSRNVRVPTRLPCQVDEALTLCRGAVPGGECIEIVREYEDLEPIPVDRQRLLEILVNLIQNARQSLDESAGPDKRIVLRVFSAGPRTVRVEVEDNGVGIPAENLSRIFNQGFTTRRGGHGLGLHISANAAAEMGAGLHAHSDGPGRGAVFRLDLPAAAGVLSAAA